MLDQPVTTIAFRIGQAIERAVALRVFKLMFQIALFLMAEGLAVTDEKLKIARVRLIHMRIINLIHDAVAQCEPEPAARMISRAQTFLGAGCPARFDAGRAKGDGVSGGV